jgi:4-hydroxy-tetrahydrodipicolinate reductase
MYPDDVVAKVSQPTAHESAKPAKIRSIHYGIGAVGIEAVRLALERSDIEVVGAIDTHPAKVGQDLGELAGLSRSLGITVAHDPEATLQQGAADVVLHATDSSLTTAYPDILRAAAAHKNVISNCPELAFPWARYPDISRKLDRHARQAGICILGTGADPGFVMNTVPLLLATACQRIRSVRVTRVTDVPPQRLELCTRIGVGLSLEGFKKGVKNGSIVGQAGLRESLLMIADTLGYRLDDIRESIEPIVAPGRLKTAYFLVDKHYVLGLRQQALGLLGGREVVSLELEMSVGASNPSDEITIDGEPPIRVSIPGGIHGELAAAAIMVNCIPGVGRGAAVGLLSMRDMPIAPYRHPGLSPTAPPSPTSL